MPPAGLDSAVNWPPALRAAAARVGPQPAALLCCLFVLVMATIAAAVPIRETSLLLYNTTERTEVRLADARGYARHAALSLAMLLFSYGVTNAVPFFEPPLAPLHAFLFPVCLSFFTGPLLRAAAGHVQISPPTPFL